MPKAAMFFNYGHQIINLGERHPSQALSMRHHWSLREYVLDSGIKGRTIALDFLNVRHQKGPL